MTSASVNELEELATVASGPRTAYVVRLATAYFVVPHGSSSIMENAPRLVEALVQDARVTHASVPALDPEWSYESTAYLPIDDEDGGAGVLEGTRHVHVQRLSEPIGIHLRVPAKNQPKVFNEDEIPTERYFVLWDGEVLLVAWEQHVEDPVGTSGGHVIEEILEQATSRIGGDLMVQACNPQCTYVFLHTALRAVVDPAAATDWSLALDEDDSTLLQVVVADEEASLTGVALTVWWRTFGCLRLFARMKNRGRQILELERTVRGDLDRLNRLHHDRARAAQRGLVARTRAVWSFRAWRRTSRYYLARLWLGLGSLERLRREWSDDALGFRRAADEKNLADLFTIDTYDEVALLESLDLGLVEAAVEHAGDRLSANVLAYATAGGAVAGAVAAAVVNAL